MAKLRDLNVGELLDAGFVVVVTHPKRSSLDAAYGDRTHPAKWELRFNDDESLKGLTAHIRFDQTTSED